MNNLLNKDHYGLQIMKDKTICIDDTIIDEFFAVCGQGQGPRSYATSWYGGEPEGNLSVHIYISDTLKSQQDHILQLLDNKLSPCKSIDNLMELNGKNI